MTFRAHVRCGALTGAVVLLTALAPLRAQDLTWSSSIGYAGGSYVFDDQLHTFSWLNSLWWRLQRINLTASLPVVAQNGTAISLVGGVPVPTGGPDAGAVQRRQSGQSIRLRPGRRTTSGSGGNGRIAGSWSLAADVSMDTLIDSLSVAGTGAYEVNVGDPMFGGTLTTYQGNGVVRSFDVGAWAKAPIASVESGVGTGAWDYAGGASLALGVAQTLLFADATWWVLGDMPDLKLKDALFYSVGIGQPLGSDWSLLGSVSASTRVSETVDAPLAVGLSLSRGLARRASFSVGASVGITESASSVSAYVAWSTKLFGGTD
ncbi:MAG: hypothetical protein AB1762_16905 [Gemmatimonadota bacterium]